MSSDIPTCWRKGSGSYIYNTNGSDVPCSGPGVSGCCVHSSECLSNGFCHNFNTGKGMSGYYMQSCTDETYDNVACPKACTRFRVPDVVYNYTANLWYCCGYDSNTGLYGCGDPTDQSFAAPPPEQLSTITSLAKSGWTLAPSSTSTTQTSSTSESSSTSDTATSSSPSSSTTAASSPAVTNPAVGTTPTPIPSTPSSGLSTGAKAGIGIGAAVGVLVVIALLGWLYLGRKRRSQNNTGHEKTAYNANNASFGEKQNRPYVYSELNSEQIHEMPNNTADERNPHGPPHELDAR